MILIGFEAFFCGLIVGLLNKSWIWGIGTWLALQVIYFIPYIGTTVTMFTSLVEAAVVYTLLNSFNLASETSAFFISLVAFGILIFFHLNYGEIDDNGSVGYGWLIFESITISAALYYSTNSTVAAVMCFAILIILSFIPRIRVAEYVALSLLTGYVVTVLSSDVVSNNTYALIAGVIIAVFSAIMYLAAFNKIDYIGIKREADLQKAIQEDNIEYSNLKDRIYHKYPELEKYYYYFYTTVCIDEKERTQFINDWRFYLAYLDKDIKYISFNDYFDMMKLYRHHYYNRDFAQQQKEQSNEQYYNQNNYNDQKEENDEEIKITYFAGAEGIDNVEGLKKRYHQLLKIYHTDNQYGDKEVCQIIQKEYEYLLKNLVVNS